MARRRRRPRGAVRAAWRLLACAGAGPGIIPSLNIAAGLLAFCCLKAWGIFAARMGWHVPTFGAQVRVRVECEGAWSARAGRASRGGLSTLGAQHVPVPANLVAGDLSTCTPAVDLTGAPVVHCVCAAAGVQCRAGEQQHAVCAPRAGERTGSSSSVSRAHVFPRPRTCSLWAAHPAVGPLTVEARAPWLPPTRKRSRPPARLLACAPRRPRRL